MRRRVLLSSLGAGLAGLAGCSSGPQDDAGSPIERTPAPTGEPPPGAAETPTATVGPTRFDLVSMDVPTTVQVGQEIPYRFAVENVGGRSGRFETTISAHGPDGEWVPLAWITGPVDAGATKTFTGTASPYPFVRIVQFRIDVFDRTFPIEFVERELAFDGTYRTPDDVKLTVKRVAFAESYSYDTGDGSTLAYAPHGRQWAFATVRARNAAEERSTLPSPDEFRFQTRSNRAEAWKAYDPVSIRKHTGRYANGSVGPDVAERGWIAYEIPNAIDFYRVVWSRRYPDGTARAVWAP